MAYHPFEKIAEAPTDPILGFTDIFNRDSSPHKINLTIGVYQNEKGVNPVLSSVKQAEKILLEEESTKTYLGIAGRQKYGEGARELLFGAGHSALTDKRAVTMHTPGGTGALRLGANFISSQFPDAAIWISDPTWANHRAVFSDAGMKVNTYPYLDKENQRLKIKELVETLQSIPEGDVVLFHGCCHNPSGLDPTKEQWDQLVAIFSQRAITPFFDFAYQGLGAGLDEDGYAIRLFGNQDIELLIAGSFSKSFGLYRERVGTLTLVCSNEEEANRSFSRLKVCARTIYSSPPAHGGLVVETILFNPELRELWLKELEEMRRRILEMRNSFVETLRSMGVKKDFSYLKAQNGMFSFCGISREEVIRLREEFSIYMLENGRINLAAITPVNIEYLCRSIATVLKGL